MPFFRRASVYSARVAAIEDLEAIRSLLDHSWRCYSGDLPPTLTWHGEAGLTWVVSASRDILGMMSAELRSFSIATIVAAAVGNGETAARCADALLPLAETALRARGVSALAHIGNAPWLTEMLGAHGFRTRQTVVTYGWNAYPLQVGGDLSITVQPARSRHLDEVAVLDRRIFDPIWHKPASELQRAFTRASEFTVATDADRVVGYQWNERNETHGHLTRLAVNPDWQSRGVGTRLFTETLSGMVEAGLTWITLNTQTDNVHSRTLYERYGFQIVGQPMPVMWKDLS